MHSITIVAALGLALTAASAAAQITKAPPQQSPRPVKAERFAKGLVHPWGLAFLPDQRLLATERPGRLRLLSKEGEVLSPISGVPGGLRQRSGRLARRGSGARFCQLALDLLVFCRAAWWGQERDERCTRQVRCNRSRRTA